MKTERPKETQSRILLVCCKALVSVFKLRYNEKNYQGISLSEDVYIWINFVQNLVTSAIWTV